MNRIEYDLNFALSVIKTGSLRTRVNCITLVLEVSKLLLLNQQWAKGAENPESAIYLIHEDFFRVIISRSGSIHSIVYPFKIEHENGTYSLKSIENRIDIDLFMLSQLMCYYKSGIPDDDQDPVSDLSLDAIAIIDELSSYEEGYVRFDDDPARENGRMHPRYHYDIFYTDQAAIKIGLNKAVDIESIIDFLSPKTNCHYIQ